MGKASRSKRERPDSPIRIHCVDFDDLCDNVKVQSFREKPVYLVDFLHAWKKECPALKVTLFAIPQRLIPENIRIFKLAVGEWVKLAPHGWRHTRGECLGWNKAEALDKLQRARDMGLDAPVFRAPGWLINNETYEACGELGLVVASHDELRIPNTGVKEYIYNRHLGHVPTTLRCIHGHLTPVSGNWIYDMHAASQLSFPAKSEFVWPWEAAKII